MRPKIENLKTSLKNPKLNFFFKKSELESYSELPKKKKPIPSVFPIEEISLQPELCSLPVSKSRGGGGCGLSVTKSETDRNPCV